MVTCFLKKEKKKKRKKENGWRELPIYIICSFSIVIGDVLVSAMPGMARKTSPTKCRLLSLLSALKNMTKSQYPNKLHEDSIITPFIGSVGIFLNAPQNSPPFPEIVLIKTWYFIMFFSNAKHRSYFCKDLPLRLCGCIATTTNSQPFQPHFKPLPKW